MALMTERHIRHLPVLAEGALVGVAVDRRHREGGDLREAVPDRAARELHHQQRLNGGSSERGRDAPRRRRAALIHDLRQPLAAMQMWVELLGEALAGQVGEKEDALPRERFAPR